MTDTKSTLKPPVIRRFSRDFSGNSKTQQHFKAGADVNNIVAQYTQTGIDPYELRKTQQKFGHASEQSFTEAMFLCRQVEQDFMKLPSSIRTEFDNNPAELLSHLQNPDSQERMAELGLIETPEPEPVILAPEPSPTPLPLSEPEPLAPQPQD